MQALGHHTVLLIHTHRQLLRQQGSTPAVSPLLNTAASSAQAALFSGSWGGFPELSHMHSHKAGLTQGSRGAHCATSSYSSLLNSSDPVTTHPDPAH
jgi:hypothetical protein